MGIANNFKQFVANVKKSINKKYLKVVDAKNDATREAIKNVEARTPRITGNLVSNWNLSFDAPDFSYTYRKRKALLPSNEEIIAQKINTFVAKRIGSKKVFIANAAPYASIINARYGMTRYAMDNFIVTFKAKFGQN